MNCIVNNNNCLNADGITVGLRRFSVFLIKYLSLKISQTVKSSSIPYVEKANSCSVLLSSQLVINGWYGVLWRGDVRIQTKNILAQTKADSLQYTVERKQYKQYETREEQ
jgi:hypothetical protein